MLKIKMLIFIFIFISVALVAVTGEVFSEKLNISNVEKRYEADWVSLDTRPLPQWYDEAKVGIFLHWGVYCVPGFESEWFWVYWRSGLNNYVNYMNLNYPRGFTYQEFAPMFQANFFDSQSWAKLFAESGAKYVVLTSKHHEGFTLFPSRQSFTWNSVDVGPKRDLVGELAQAVRKQGLKFGIYHSLYEWYNPMYQNDKANHFNSMRYTHFKLWPDLKQIVHNYRPSVIWADGDWEAYDTYWKSTAFLAWLYNDSPVKDEVVVNDRWGIGIPGKHGDFYNFADRFNNRTLQGHKWENAFTVDSKSWGYRRNMDLRDILSTSDLLNQLVTTVSCGGNVLINIGPTQDGTISPIFQARLLSLGLWLAINGEAIYKSSPWLSQNDTLNGDVWYTCTKTKFNALEPTAKPDSEDDVTAVYATALKWPKGNVLKLRDVSSYLRSGNYEVVLLGNEDIHLNTRIAYVTTEIQLPDKSTVKSANAWTLKFTLK